MDSRYNRRPPKYSIGQAIGEALQGTGQYFGALAVEKKKAENIELARSYQKADLAEQRTYEEGREDTLYQRQLDDKASALTAAEDERDGNVARAQSIKGSDLISSLSEADAADIDPNKVYEVNLNAEGAVMGFHEDTDFTVDDAGNIGKLSAGTKGASGKKQTEAQMKLGLHLRTMTASRNEMENLLKKGYGLDSIEGFTDRAANALPFGNYLQTSDGQRFHMAAQRLAETLFKGESGAAGSDAEAARYRSFVPNAGDTAETVKQKLRILDATQAAFAEASGLGMSRDDAVLHARATADVEVQERGFVFDAQVANSAEDDELFNKYGLD